MEHFFGKFEKILKKHVLATSHIVKSNLNIQPHNSVLPASEMVKAIGIFYRQKRGTSPELSSYNKPRCFVVPTNRKSNQMF